MDFDQMNSTLSDYGEFESPSFLHGMLMGLLCADNDLDITIWIKKLLQEAQVKKIKESLLVSLHEMYLTTQKGMNGSGFELELCLPDDDAKLSYRLHMASQLCEGVLYGIGLGGGLSEMEHELSEDVRDVIQALGEISRVDISVDLDKDESQGSEADLVEIVEFIRVSILLLNEELNPTTAAPIMDEEELGHDGTLQ